jgi:DNA-binding NarL/FixJ family response regulator
MDGIQRSVISVQLLIESVLAKFCLPVTDYRPDEQEGGMKTTAVPTILVVEDNVFNRQGVCWYLQQQGFRVLTAGDAQTAWETAVSHQPAAVIIDVVIPPTPDNPRQTEESVGAQLAARLKKQYPNTGVVLFSAYEDRGQELFALLLEGARGLAYKLKGCAPAELLQAVHDVLAGRVTIDAEATPVRLFVANFNQCLTPEERTWVEKAAARLPRLTPREREIAQRLAAAHTIRGVAEALNLEPKTVENNVGRIYHKLALKRMGKQAPHLRPIVVLAKACLLADLQADTWPGIEK